MSKLSRTVLKEIVKECIVEIFEESFFPAGMSLNENSRSSRKRTRPKAASERIPTRRQGLDSIAYGTQESSQSPDRFDRKVEKITSAMTKDPVMSEIFKDTAATTLQQQLGAENSKGASVLAGGDAAAKAAYAADPTELFAESASKWATLAFAENIKK